MSDFDPYHKWLAIPPKDQPANLYRLLAVELFELDPDVISNAADQRMAHLRSFQSGANSAVSQKILNEISAARLCLLNPNTKEAYDKHLRKKLEASSFPPPPPAAMQPATMPLPVAASSASLSLPPRSAPFSSPPLSTPLSSPPPAPELEGYALETDHLVFSPPPVALSMTSAESARIKLALRKKQRQVNLAIFLGLGLLLIAAFAFVIIAKVRQESAEKLLIAAKAAQKGGQEVAQEVPPAPPAPPKNLARKPEPPKVDVKKVAKDKPPKEPEQKVPAGKPLAMNIPPVNPAVRGRPGRGNVPLDPPHPKRYNAYASLENISLALPSGETFDSQLFEIDLMYVKRTFEEILHQGDTLNFLEMNNSNTQETVYLEHDNGRFDGIFMVYYAGYKPKVYAEYEEGSLMGVVKYWGEDGERICWCQYLRGLPHGYSCYFQEDRLRLLLETCRGKITALHLCQNNEIEKSFDSLEAANQNSEAKVMLELVLKTEEELKSAEPGYRQQARKEANKVKLKNQSRVNPGKRVRIQNSIDNHYNQRNNYLKYQRSKSAF